MSVADGQLSWSVWSEGLWSTAGPAVPAPWIAEVTQARLMDAGSQFPGGKVDRVDANAALLGMEMMGRRKEKQVPSPATNKVKPLAIPLLLPVALSL